MKRHAGTFLRILVPMLISISGCLEVDVRTTVSDDGSSERVISMKCPTMELPEGAFPFGVDSTWSVEWKETGEKDTKYEYTARKRFPSPEALHDEYATRPDTGIVGLRVSLAKRFQWFYTYLDYRETYVMRNAYTNVPVSDYMTNEEIERYVRGEDSDSLNRKVKMWDSRNLFEEIYRPILAEVERRNDPALPASLLKDRKEALFALMVAADSAQEAASKNGKDSTKKEPEFPEILLKGLAEGLQTEAIYKFRPAVELACDVIEKKESGRKHPNSWKNSVQMPGLLIEANSDAVEGNTITWKFSTKQIHVGDYKMEASSRVTNVWAFVLTGVAVLAVALTAIRSLFRRRP